MAEKLLLNPKVDGLFFWAVKGTPHYGASPRSIGLAGFSIRGCREHLGLESTVAVTFEKSAKDTT